MSKIGNTIVLEKQCEVAKIWLAKFQEELRNVNNLKRTQLNYKLTKFSLEASIKELEKQISDFEEKEKSYAAKKNTR